MLSTEPRNTIITSFERISESSKFQQKLETALLLAQESDSDQFFSVTLQARVIDTLAFLEKIQSKDSFRYYWEQPNDDFSMIAAGELVRIKPKGVNRFRLASQQGKELLNRITHYSEISHSKSTIHLLGGFSFYDENKNGMWESFSTASFTLPEWHILKEGRLSLITVNLKLSREDTAYSVIERFSKQFHQLDTFNNVGEFNEMSPKSPDLEAVESEGHSEYKRWMDNVKKATEQIKEGLYKKIVVARRLHLKTKEDISDTCLLNKLRQQYPDCYLFLIGFNDEGTFIGATPERLATFKRHQVLTEGLAGSISRGKTALEDAFLEHSLLNSSKDLNEHAIVVDAIEASLSPYSTEIQHPDQPGIKKLSNVQHLYTPVTAFLNEDVSRTEILKKLHPTPAVGGFPREMAVPHIKELEDFDRGWYAGPIGWINANGEGEFAVAIRSGLIKKNEAHFFAGCGIVEDSDPQKEWEETNLKFIPMLTALKYATQ